MFWRETGDYGPTEWQNAFTASHRSKWTPVIFHVRDTDADCLRPLIWWVRPPAHAWRRRPQFPYPRPGDASGNMQLRIYWTARLICTMKILSTLTSKSCLTFDYHSEFDNGSFCAVILLTYFSLNSACTPSPIIHWGYQKISFWFITPQMVAA